MKALVYNSYYDGLYLYWGALSAHLEYLPYFESKLRYESEEDIVIPGEFL